MRDETQNIGGSNSSREGESEKEMKTLEMSISPESSLKKRERKTRKTAKKRTEEKKEKTSIEKGQKSGDLSPRSSTNGQTLIFSRIGNATLTRKSKH